MTPRPLLLWYARRRRDLPWRRTRDPYRIWVAEVMLQQTRVDQARPYYARFLRRFPDVRRLARAEQESVLKAWEGLGYYARARLLHRAAREIVERHGGRVPADPEAASRLPGFGPYTTAAVLSIAYGRDLAAVDGNAARVLSRVLALEETGTRLRERAAREAGRILPPGRAGEFNQALMDLGATVCLPRRPRCGECPWASDCRARRDGDPQAYPRRARRRLVPHRHIAVGLVWKGNRILVGRRPENGLLGGLWEFPGGKVKAGERWAGACAREIREETGVEARVGEKVATVEHAYTHFRVTLHVFACRWRRGRARPIGCSKVRWVRPCDLGRFAFPAANRKIFPLLLR